MQRCRECWVNWKVSFLPILRPCCGMSLKKNKQTKFNLNLLVPWIAWPWKCYRCISSSDGNPGSFQWGDIYSTLTPFLRFCFFYPVLDDTVRGCIKYDFFFFYEKISIALMENSKAPCLVCLKTFLHISNKSKIWSFLYTVYTYMLYYYEQSNMDFNKYIK